MSHPPDAAAETKHVALRPAVERPVADARHLRVGRVGVIHLWYLNHTQSMRTSNHI